MSGCVLHIWVCFTYLDEFYISVCVQDSMTICHVVINLIPPLQGNPIILRDLTQECRKNI